MRQTFSLIRLSIVTLLLIVGNKAIAQTESQAVTDILTAETFVFPTAGMGYSKKDYTSSKATYSIFGRKLDDDFSIPYKKDQYYGGIVTTASNANITQLNIKWSNRSTACDTLYIYGKNEAYESVNDLYDTSTEKTGELLTSFTYTDNIYTYTGEYKYIGIRPSTTLVLTSVEITYNGSDTPTDPDPEPETPTQQPQTLSFPAAAYTVTLGEPFNAPKVTGAQTSVTYTSSNTEVASIDATEGSITIIGVGTTTITASAVESESYSAASASYTLTVNEKEVVDDGIINGTYALVAEHQGNHYAMSSTPRDAKSLIGEAITLVNGKVVAPKDELKWTITPTNEQGSKHTIQANTGNYLTGSTSTTLTLESKSMEWTRDDTNNSWINSNDRTFVYTIHDNCFVCSAISNITNPKDYMSGYTSPMPIVDGHVREGMEERKLGSICLPYGVKAEDISGAYFYRILGKKVDANGKPTSLVCYQVTEDLEAGMPYLFLAKSSDPLIMAYSGEAVNEPKNQNGMYGTLEKTTVTEVVYFISDNKLRPCAAGSGIRANRTYIKMDEVAVYTESASYDAKRILEIGDNDSTTSLESIQTERTVDVYSINGILLRKKVNSDNATHGLRPGLYIVDGKKVMVK